MSTESLPARLVRRTEVLGFVKSNNEVSATDLTILETWNTPEEFYEGLSAVGDVVAALQFLTQLRFIYRLLKSICK